MRSAEALVGVFALLALASCDPGPKASPGPAPVPPTYVRQAPSDWPTYHGGFSLDGVAEAAPPDNPVRLWKFKVESRVAFTPVSGGGRVYFTTAKGELFALDWNGGRAWKAGIAEDAFSAPPLYADNVVIVGSGNGVLYAFEGSTGEKKWTAPVGHAIQGTANRVDLAGGGKGIIALSQSDGAIYCMEMEKGNLVWKTGPLERCDGSPGVGSGKIVMGSCASALHVFSIQKPDARVDIDLGEDGQVAGGVALSGHQAFAGTRGGKVHAVDLVEGKIVWTNGDGTREAFTTPAVNARFVVFGSGDGKVYGLNRETGAKVWDFDTGGKPSSPVIAGNRVVVSSSGSLFLLDLETGRKIWTLRVSDEITSPAVAGGRVIVGADDGTVSTFGAGAP